MMITNHLLRYMIVHLFVELFAMIINFTTDCYNLIHYVHHLPGE